MKKLFIISSLSYVLFLTANTEIKQVEISTEIKDKILKKQTAVYLQEEIEKLRKLLEIEQASK